MLPDVAPPRRGGADWLIETTVRVAQNTSGLLQYAIASNGFKGAIRPPALARDSGRLRAGDRSGRRRLPGLDVVRDGRRGFDRRAPTALRGLAPGTSSRPLGRDLSLPGVAVGVSHLASVLQSNLKICRRWSTRSLWCGVQ